MIDYSNPSLLFLRTLGRRLGILRPLFNLIRALRPREYESEVQSELLKHVRPGQVIWDVGANEGFYVELLLKLVGPAGKIVAFEPSLDSYGVLLQKYSACPNVHLENVALSDREGFAPFFLSPTKTTNSLVYTEKIATSEIQILTKRGDLYASSFFPDIVKIDVEGYELEVLKGMHHILTSQRLECLFLEVHFSILSERGVRDAPAVIVRMLTQAGLAVSWIDPSHLLASRLSAFE